MATPKKVDSITLSKTTLDNSNLPVTEFNKTDLIAFLNTVTSAEVVLFFEETGSGTTTANRLVIAEIDSNGKPSSTKQLPGNTLPCPPYC